MAATAVMVSTLGSDVTCRRGDLSKPCATFNKAYSIARCGDTIEVAGGYYARQTLIEVGALSSCSTNVVIKPASGASVTVEAVAFGDCGGGCFAANAADRVTLRNMAVANYVQMWGDADHVTIEGIDGGSIYIQGVSNVTVQNSDFGPCVSHIGTCSGQFFLLDGRGVGEPPTTNVLIENNAIHDYTIRPDSLDHFECIFATGGTNITIRGNRIYNCETYGIALGENAGVSKFDGWVIENNWLGRTCCFGTNDRASAIVIGGSTQISGVVIRANTFLRGQGVVSEGGPPAISVAVERNILQFTGCVPGVRYSRNLVAGGGCSPDDRESVYGYQFDGARLRVVSRQAKAVQTAFRTVDEGLTLRAAARLLARMGFPAPPGGWNRSTVRSLLTDTVYLGRRLGRPDEHVPVIGKKRWNAAQKAVAGAP